MECMLADSRSGFNRREMFGLVAVAMLPGATMRYGRSLFELG
jgi:hypothetical protein